MGIGSGVKAYTDFFVGTSSKADVNTVAAMFVDLQ